MLNVVDQILEMTEYCSQNSCSRSSKYDRLHYKLRDTDYVLVEVHNKTLPKIINRHTGKKRDSLPDANDDNDSGISSLYKKPSLTKYSPVNMTENEIRMNKLINRLDDLDLKITSATTKAETFKKLSTSSTEVFDDEKSRIILSKMKSMEEKIAAAL